MNDRAALSALLSGPLTKRQIGALTGLSRVTAGHLVDRLMRRGLVTRAGQASGGTGPRAELYCIARDSAFVVGVDTGPDRLIARCSDMVGTTVGQFEQSIGGSCAGGDLVRKAVTVAAQQGRVSISQLRRVVLSTSGRPASTTSTEHTGRSGRRRVLLDALDGWPGNRISVETSGNLAAIAEAEQRSRDGVANFILVWFEVGVTLAFWLNGALYRGSDHEDGRVQPRRRPCDSGRSTGAAAVPAAQAASWQEIPDALSSVTTLCAALAPQAVILGGRTDAVRLAALAVQLRQELTGCPASPAVTLSSSLDETVLQGAVLAGLQSVRDELWSC